MEIQEVTFEEYSDLFPKPYHIFGSGSFSNLNSSKVEKTYYLLFKDNKYRLGLTGGLRNGGFFTPFSAPYGGFIFLNEDIKIFHIDDAIQTLIKWCRNQNMNLISFTLPPDIYHESFISKQTNCLFRNGFTLKKVDLNYAFNLNKFNTNYPSNIWYNARRNLKISLSKELSFKKCELSEEKIAAYNVIKINRKKKGFPLHMTFEDIEKTSRIIPSDFFLVYNNDAVPIASAIIFHVSPGIVQVIYWGDLPEFYQLRTMNFLSYKIFEYYKNKGLRIVDIGISTEFSEPNPGLCEFKESIGCNISNKCTFLMELI